jgi:ketosteroid isomerase-like protein
MSDANVAVVERLFEAVARGDIEGALRLVGPDGEWVNPDYAMEPGTRRGLDGVRVALTALIDSFAELRFDLSETTGLDGRVLVIGTFSGVGRASDVAFGSQTFGAVLTLAEGLVQRYEWFLDQEEARRAFGLPSFG